MSTLFQDEPEMKVGCIAPWFGSNRMLAAEVGKALKGCEWVAIPFAGGMAEVPHIEARAIVVNDLHRHVINAAFIAAHPLYGPRMYRRLRRLPFDGECLEQAQEHCKLREAEGDLDTLDDEQRFQWAVSYFSSCWMGRSAKAGTDEEFKGNLPLRWSASGGDSAVRFQSAVRSIPAFRRTLRRCNFSTLDFRPFLAKCKDELKHGIYSDSPFPDAGDGYRHKFTERDHRDLAALLGRYTKTRVVCRFYSDHPLVRELYPESKWRWQHLVGRKQSNADAPEVLLMLNA